MMSGLGSSARTTSSQWWRNVLISLGTSAASLFVLRWLVQRSKRDRLANADEKSNEALHTGNSKVDSAYQRIAPAADSQPDGGRPQAAAPSSLAANDSEFLQRGERVIIDGLRSKPELNGKIGVLVQFIPEKERWAVRILAETTGFMRQETFEPILVRLENLRREDITRQQSADSTEFSRANSEEDPATTAAFSSKPGKEFQKASVKVLDWAGKKVHLVGVPGYGSAVGGDAIFNSLDCARPGVVLMESFDVGDETIDPGDALPYQRILGRGLIAAIETVASSSFRKEWTSEAVAVLTALRVGAEIRLCDRLHVVSFDRLIRRLTVTDLKHALIKATEDIATLIEGNHLKMSEMPQNVLCPLFIELGIERHMIMAHFARQAAEQGHDVAVVVGEEHVEGIADVFEQPFDVTQLLQASDAEQAVDEDAAWEEELEKRAAIAAFLSSTRTFPPDVVLLPREQLVPKAAELAAKFYPKYREAFMLRLTEALGGPEKALASVEDGMNQSRARGLAQLHELCDMGS